jgi:RimJ/RimL family protein N-acetyltransferase
MSENILLVRELRESDIELIIQYWLSSDKSFLEGMGADITRIPSRDEWDKMLSEQLSQPFEEKKSYCVIWEVGGRPIGHSNVNKIIFGEEAYMHLHMWNESLRQKGMGTALVKKSTPYYFENLKLKKLYCEPYALNPAPNNVLKKIGFKFIKEYRTTPGWLNFEQAVNRWELSYDNYKKLSLQ